MKRKVFISQRAEKNLDDILHYLQSEWSARVRDKFLLILREKVDLLSQSPFLYQATVKEKSIRRCIVTRQVVLYYKITGEDIEIITIQDTRQNPEGLKL